MTVFDSFDRDVYELQIGGCSIMKLKDATAEEAREKAVSLTEETGRSVTVVRLVGKTLRSRDKH